MNRNDSRDTQGGSPVHHTPPAIPESTRIDDLESQVKNLISTEPKDFARASVLLYDVCRLRGDDEEALHLAGIFDLPAMVLYQTLYLVRGINTAPETAQNETEAALTRADDLIRLAVLALDGDTSADIVREMTGWRDALARAGDHPEHSSVLARAGDRLAYVVNAFFFDRLTAMPTLRDYVVRLELGI